VTRSRFDFCAGAQEVVPRFDQAANVPTQEASLNEIADDAYGCIEHDAVDHARPRRCWFERVFVAKPGERSARLLVTNERAVRSP
jgi:hypothetical protein